MTTVHAPTAEFASLVYGEEGVALDDPAEAFHEASRLYPHVAPGRLANLLAAGRSQELQRTIDRSSRTHAARPGIDLPRVRIGRTSLRKALDRRVSALDEAGAPLALRHLSALLGMMYAARARADGAVRRPVPSGGALYPLELYVLPLLVPELDRSVFHYDPFRHRLEALRPMGDVAAALVDPGLAERAACIVVVSGMFWRSRFKYGQRGYRFTLLEAGHVGQNLVLGAAAMGTSALPIGGFYDRRVDALVGADGLDESTVYLVAIGGSPR